MREFLQREAARREDFVDELIENAALAPAGTRFRIADEHGRWLYQSPGTEKWGAALDPKVLPVRGRFETVTQNRRPVRVLSAIVPAGVVQIGIPIDEFLEMLDAFTWTALIASPLAAHRSIHRRLLDEPARTGSGRADRSDCGGH